MPAKSFLLVIVDEDNSVFNVVGPISSEAGWNRRVVELQERGRNVKCFSSRHKQPIDSLINSYHEQTGYTFSSNLIVEEPEDVSMVYTGALPLYAKGADRKRVVRLFCERCRTTRWFEMNVEYPGQEALRESDGLGEYTATCLKCGQVATDSYNWYR